MNIAELSIKKSVITWVLTFLLLFVGIKSYNSLSRLEDPEFTIKDALIFTPYPGASAEEVSEEVSNVIEKAVQELGQLKSVESHSWRGMSMVKPKIKDNYDKDGLPQVWDELRRKVNDYQGQLPPGAGPSLVNDDFGDVYGIYVVLTGEGYSMAELKEYAKFLRRELLMVQDVKKIALWGAQQESIYVEMSRAKMASLGVSQEQIYGALQAKNLAADGGRIHLPPEYIPINPTGEFTSEQQFGDLLIVSREGGRSVFLRNVADIRRGYVDPPTQIMRANGQRGIALGVSTVAGGNVVTMGEGISERMRQLRGQMPLGMNFEVVAMQSEAVTDAINGFMVNLIEAVVIVIVVLLFFMGLRSGLIVGFILFVTISGTFLFMSLQGVVLERISLGALIIALGMLVDNAIVIVDGMKVKIEAGEDPLKAAKDVVGQQTMPLLGATVVAIVAFAAIGTSPDSTGEYCRSLFTVIMISLGLSWVTAVTITPLVTSIFIKPLKDGAGKDPYGGAMFRAYRTALSFCIGRRWATVAVVVGIFAASLWGFGFVDNMFFPSSTRPQFFVEMYLPEGTHIRDTEKTMMKVEEYLMGVEGVTDVASAIGGGDLRFLLTYGPLNTSSSNAVVFATVDDWTKIDGMMKKVQRDLEELVPEAVAAGKKFRLGPGEGGRIQLRISGPDRDTLREMGQRVKQIMADAGAIAVRDEWKQKAKVIRPQVADTQALQQGIERPQIANTIQANFDGVQTGVYRERDELLPIIARAPEYERKDARELQDLQIWSPLAGRMIPMSQVVTGLTTEFEDANIWRRNRTTTMKIHCDPRIDVLPSALAGNIKPRIERELNVDLEAYLGKSFKPGEDPWANHTASTIPIKFMDKIPLKDMPGYYIAWGGEDEDGAKAQGFLFASIPAFIGIMVLTVVFLFNAVRQPLIIWLTVPLAVIGVTVGLLVTKQPFGFMALLGMLSLSGMLIKNAIVLIDQIDLEIREGKDKWLAVVDSGVSRLRPVSMAAATTILGMLPLFADAFFISMAVTIAFGLAFATVLTLIFVPVLYTIFFKIPSPATPPTGS
jgi:multidrug efflux pump subunit AcrB